MVGCRLHGAEHDEAGVAGEGEPAFGHRGAPARTATTMPIPSGHALALHDTLYLRAEGVSTDEIAKRVAEGGARADVAVGRPGGQPSS